MDNLLYLSTEAFKKVEQKIMEEEGIIFNATESIQHKGKFLVLAQCIIFGMSNIVTALN